MIGNLQLAICLLLMFYLGRHMYQRLVWDVKGGRPVVAFIDVLFIGPIPLLFLAKFGEGRDITDFFDLGKMPWSLLGDIVVIAPAFAVAALAWRERPLNDRAWFFDSHWWPRACVAIGFACGLTFHLLDANGYRDMGAAALVTAFTKVIHDLVIFTILIAALLRVGVPLLANLSWPKLPQFRWGFILLVTAQITLMVIDVNRGLDPHNFHLPCDLKCGSDNLTDHVMGWARSTLQHFALIE